MKKKNKKKWAYLVLVPVGEPGDGVEPPGPVGGDDLSLAVVSGPVPPPQLVPGDDPVAALLRRRLPADDQGLGPGRLHRHVGRRVGRHVRVRPSDNLG